MGSCFFTGHRETMGEIYPQLEAAIEQHITQFGVREFIVGNYGGFDRVVARALVAAKAQHPEIVLLLLVPLTIPQSDRYKRLQGLMGHSIRPGWKMFPGSSPSFVPTVTWLSM